MLPDPPPDLSAAVAVLRDAVTVVQSVDLDGELPRELLAAMGALEVERRRLDAATDAVVGAVESSGAYGVDGHTSTRATLKHICRLPGDEAARTVSAVRVRAGLPKLRAAHDHNRLKNAGFRTLVDADSRTHVRPDVTPITAPV